MKKAAGLVFLITLFSGCSTIGYEKDTPEGRKFVSDTIATGVAIDSTPGLERYGLEE